jgi:hypothetical protein
MDPIMPSQFDALKGVFDAIVAEPWFHNTEDSRQDISDLVMRQFRLGVTEPAALLHACSTIARERYSRE